MVSVSSQARQWLRSAVLTAVIFLMAAPAALADPSGDSFTAPEHSAPAIVSTSSPPPSCDAPKPGASFLSDAHAWEALEKLAHARPPFG